VTRFFEPPPPPREEPDQIAPPWYGPPEDVIGEAVATSFVLARTEALALTVWGITAFPTGVAFTLAIVKRITEDLDPYEDPDMTMHLYPRRRRGSDELPDDLLRFGVQFEDGGKATSLAFVCEWPARGIGLTRHEIETGPIRRAAERARPIWENEPPG
jgi:hypothetical protein